MYAMAGEGEGAGVVLVWDFNVEEVNSHGNGKAKVW